MQILYFASVREAIGQDGEDLPLSGDVKTIADVINTLAGRGDAYAAAFAAPEKLRFALDQHMAKIDVPIGDAKELAIFPPVTGG